MTWGAKVGRHEILIDLNINLFIYQFCSLGKPFFKKTTEFYEIISQTGGGINWISYLLFRNSNYL